MKISPIILALILIGGSCPDAFGQKCKDKTDEIGLYVYRGAGPRIVRKPQPEYTKEARRRKITGTVVLRAVFHSSGKVKNVCWMSSLPYGLTENAIKAAYEIVFEPVTKEGRSISVTRAIDYNFILY